MSNLEQNSVLGEISLSKISANAQVSLPEDNLISSEGLSEDYVLIYNEGLPIFSTKEQFLTSGNFGVSDTLNIKINNPVK